MKKFFAIAILAVAFTACTSSENKEETPAVVDSAAASVTAPVAAAVDTAAAATTAVVDSAAGAVKAAVDSVKK